MLEITDTTFETEVLKASGLVIIDFWAPWCGPCKLMGPIMEKLAEEFAGKLVKIAKMNVDENQTTPSGFGIMSIPTFLFFKNGTVVDQVVGAQSKEVMKGRIEKHLH